MTDVMVDDVARALRAEGYEVCVGEQAMPFNTCFHARVLSDGDVLFTALYWDGRAENGVTGRSVYIGYTATLDQIVEVAHTFRVQCGEAVR